MECRSVSTLTPREGYEFGANEWLIEEMYEKYLEDPGSVDETWREYFRALAEVPAAQSPDVSADPPAPAKAQAAPSAPADPPAPPQPPAPHRWLQEAPE